MTTPHLRLIWLPFNLHQTRSFRSAVPATCEPRSAASSPRVADGSLGQLPQKGSRRLFARFCASCRRHYQRAAAVSCRGGGRRPRYRLRFAPALRAEIQRGSSVQQSHTLLLLYSPIFVLAAAAERRVDARLARCGLPPPVATSWACAINTPPSVFNTQNQPPNKRQSAVLSAARSALCALLNPRHTSRSPSQRAGRHGCRQRRPSRRPGSLVSLQARSRPTTGLHLAERVALFAHATVLLAWLRQRHQARRIGSLFMQAPSSGQHAPCRGWGRRASPRGTSAAMALPTASAAPRRLAFGAGA